jgi:hypothetical protein
VRADPNKMAIVRATQRLFIATFWKHFKSIKRYNTPYGCV